MGQPGLSCGRGFSVLPRPPLHRFWVTLLPVAGVVWCLCPQTQAGLATRCLQGPLPNRDLTSHPLADSKWETMPQSASPVPA